jgi:hypothetical protein
MKMPQRQTVRARLWLLLLLLLLLDAMLHFAVLPLPLQQRPPVALRWPCAERDSDEQQAPCDRVQTWLDQQTMARLAGCVQLSCSA